MNGYYTFAVAAAPHSRIGAHRGQSSWHFQIWVDFFPLPLDWERYIGCPMSVWVWCLSALWLHVALNIISLYIKRLLKIRYSIILFTALCGSAVSATTLFISSASQCTASIFPMSVRVNWNWIGCSAIESLCDGNSVGAVVTATASQTTTPYCHHALTAVVELLPRADTAAIKG